MPSNFGEDNAQLAKAINVGYPATHSIASSPGALPLENAVEKTYLNTTNAEEDRTSDSAALDSYMHRLSNPYANNNSDTTKVRGWQRDLLNQGQQQIDRLDDIYGEMKKSSILLQLIFQGMGDGNGGNGNGGNGEGVAGAAGGGSGGRSGILGALGVGAAAGLGSLLGKAGGILKGVAGAAALGSGELAVAIGAAVAFDYMKKQTMDDALMDHPDDQKLSVLDQAKMTYVRRQKADVFSGHIGEAFGAGEPDSQKALAESIKTMQKLTDQINAAKEEIKRLDGSINKNSDEVKKAREKAEETLDNAQTGLTAAEAKAKGEVIPSAQKDMQKTINDYMNDATTWGGSHNYVSPMPTLAGRVPGAGMPDGPIFGTPFTRTDKGRGLTFGPKITRSGGLSAGDNGLINVDAKSAQEAGFSSDQWNAYRLGVTDIENKSGGYGIKGGAGGNYLGKYQMGHTEIRETAARLGVQVPSDQSFLGDPSMQEKFFENYTMDHYNTLMKDPAFSKMSKEDQLKWLGYGHNQGIDDSIRDVGNAHIVGALAAIHGRGVGHDAFGTSGFRYFNTIGARLAEIGDNKPIGGGFPGSEINKGVGLDMRNPSDSLKIAKYMKEAGIDLNPQNFAWCAAWVNAQLKHEGVPGSGSSLANSFASWGRGERPQDASKGDIMELNNGSHVGRFTGRTRMGKNGMEYEMYSGNSGEGYGHGMRGVTDRYYSGNEINFRGLPRHEDVTSHIDQNIFAHPSLSPLLTAESNKSIIEGRSNPMIVNHFAGNRISANPDPVKVAKADKKPERAAPPDDYLRQLFTPSSGGVGHHV